MRVTKPRYKVVAGGDIHFPFHNRKAVSEFLTLIRCEQPTHTVLMGDTLDMYNLSRYLKKPKSYSSMYEIQEARRFFKKLKKVSPNSIDYILEGNHEERQTKYLLRNSPELLEYECLKVPNLLGLDDFGIHWVPARSELRIDGILYTHGRHTCVDAGGSVKKEQLKYREDMVMGHCHRLALIHTQAGIPGGPNQIVGVEAGFLGDKKSEGFAYVNKPNWCNGAVVINKRKVRLEVFE